MPDTARDCIFTRLLGALSKAPSHIADLTGSETLPVVQWSKKEKIQRLKTLMEVVRTEVHVVPAKKWPYELKQILKPRGLQTLLYAPKTGRGRELARAWSDDTHGLPQLKTYDGRIETFKDQLFDIDAAVTTTRGGIAETGAVILWPTEAEPRLMSLVPHIHIVLLEAEAIYGTFAEVIEKQKWAANLPTNALLISGPSKTADIEFTLAFGVHGPKELILLILK